jgi:hypothetical protein
MDIVAAFEQVGTYRGAAALCGTTHKTVRRVIDAQRDGLPAERPRKPSAPKIDDAYDAVLAAYCKWARTPGEVGWVLGDTLSTLADRSRADTIVELASDSSTGSSRACIVESLWRFKATVRLEPLLVGLVRDPDVAFMAVTSLRRTLGPERSLEVLRDVLATTADEVVTRAASRAARRIEKRRNQ